MSWGDFWKSKEDKEFEEFLSSPKELYEKVKTTIAAKDAEIEDFKRKLEISKSNYKTLNKIYNELDEEHTDLQEKYEKASNKSEILEEQNEEVIEKLKTETTDKLEQEYKLKLMQKEAQLEKDFHHEVHEFLEGQQDRMEELVSSIFEKGIKTIKEILDETKKIS